jgi:hypothetical protein
MISCTPFRAGNDSFRKLLSINTTEHKRLQRRVKEGLEDIGTTPAIVVGLNMTPPHSTMKDLE